MKSILIIGLGRFGRHMALKFMDLGDEVFAIDTKEDRVNDLAPYVTRAEIGDCTREPYVASLGVHDLGAQRIVCRAHSEVHEKFLLRTGADAVIYPERETSENAAVQYSMDNIFDYINLGDDYSIVEIRIPSDWVGKSLRALDVRSRYRVNILATKRGEMIYPAIAPDAVLEADETLILMGRLKDIRDLTED